MATWTIDTAHSEIGFKVKHLVISTVSGKFTAFDAKVEASDDSFKDLKLSFSADIASIHTGNDQRDGHLKSPDFFDAETHPKLTFVSTSVESAGDAELKVTGDLTIRGTTKPITLNVEIGGVQKNMYGQTVAGFEVAGKLNRQEFGLTWSAVTEAGGIVVSDEVKLHANVEMVKEA